MEGNGLNNKDRKGKAKVDISKDVQEHAFFPNEGRSIFEEGNGSENKNPENEAIVSSDSLENSPQDQPSPVDLPIPDHDLAAGSEAIHISSPQPRAAPKGDALVSQVDDGPTEERPRTRSYSCRYCTKLFSSAQALGGHQNSHKYEREFAKRQRVHEAQGYVPYNYGRLPTSLTLGLPRLPSYNANNLTLARPPLGFPYSTPGFPNAQNPRSTVGLPLGHFGQSSGMLFRNTQLLDRRRTTNPYMGNDNHISGNFNSMGIEGGGEGGLLGSFRGPNGNNRSMWSEFNSMAGGQGSGSNTQDLQALNENNGVPGDGFEAAGTSSSDLFRTLFGVSQGESNVREEIRDTVKVCGDQSDGTIDLLSRVGMDSGIDGEGNGGGSNGETDGALDLLSRVGVTDRANEEDNGAGSSSSLD